MVYTHIIGPVAALIPILCAGRFIGKMSRIEAEQCLHRMKDGVFLIRESDARQGEYAIALRYITVTPVAIEDGCVQCLLWCLFVGGNTCQST